MIEEPFLFWSFPLWAAVNLSFSFRTPSTSWQESGTTINCGNENSVIILFTFGLRLQETIDGWIPDATPDLIFGILLMISMSFAYESYSFDSAGNYSTSDNDSFENRFHDFRSWLDNLSYAILMKSLSTRQIPKTWPLHPKFSGSWVLTLQTLPIFESVSWATIKSLLSFNN